MLRIVKWPCMFNQEPFEQLNQLFTSKLYVLLGDKCSHFFWQTIQFAELVTLLQIYSIFATETYWILIALENITDIK